jgi:hypothetical protein
MTAGQDWEFLCVLHGKKGTHCCPVDYCVHNLETIQNLLSDRTYFCFKRDIKGRSVLALPQMFKNIHRMIAHTCYYHKDVFNKYEEKYHLNERLVFFCKKFKILKKKTYHY